MVARSPSLARAALAELYHKQHSGSIETEAGHAVEFAAHAVELERQKAAILAIDADVRAEARVNKVCIMAGTHTSARASKYAQLVAYVVGTATTLLTTPLLHPNSRNRSHMRRSVGSR